MEKMGGDDQVFFEAIPTVIVQVQRDRKESKIRVECVFYKANAGPSTREIKPRDPPYVTTATGLRVYMYPNTGDGSKTEAVTAIWPAAPKRKPKKTSTKKRTSKTPIKKGA